MGYLKNITRRPGGQLGGILTIEVLRKADIVSLDSPVNGIIVSAPVLKAGAGLVKWVVTQGTAGLTSDARITREGPSKANTLSFFIPLDRDDIRQMLEIAENDEFVVLYQYPNGKKKIFGTLALPVRFQFSHSSGTKSGETNGNNCQFYYTGPDNTSFYQAENPPSTEGPSPAVVLFNGVAIASLQPGETLNILSDYSFNEYFTTS